MLDVRVVASTSSTLDRSPAAPRTVSGCDVLEDHEGLVVTVAVEIGHDQLLDGAEGRVDGVAGERRLSEGVVRAGSGAR